MRALVLFLMLLVLAPPALADSIARQGNDWVRISALLCKDEAVVEQIKAAGRDPLDFRAATAHFQGVDYPACWVPRGNVIILVYGDGDQGLIPVGDLKPVPEA